MKKLFETWRGFIQEEVDIDVLHHIAETLETLIELPVRSMYACEKKRDFKVLLDVDLEEHAPELMSLIQNRWNSSSELQELRQMGYNVDLIASESEAEGYDSITKELL